MSRDVIDLFDKVAVGYDTVVPFFASFGRQCADRLPEPVPGSRLLDVGAGRGAIAVPARDRGYAVTATDASPAMAALLRDDRPELDVQVMDAERLGFAAETFDVVTAGFVVHLLDDPGRAVAEARRVLRPGGLFAVLSPGRVPESFEFADDADALFAEFSRFLPPAGGMGSPFDAPTALAAAGFTDVIETDLRVELPLPDAESFWRWLLSHGTRKFLEDLEPGHREEFRRRLVADLEARGSVVLRRYAWLCTGRRDGA